MFDRILWCDLEENRREELLRRPAVNNGHATRESVLPIINAVRAGGDVCLRELTVRFDKVALENLRVQPSEREFAFSQVNPEQRAAMDHAIANISRFHQAQGSRPFVVETQPGVRCERVVRPISRVGLYVPAGSAPLVSTVLMLGIPARIAGCPTRILCVPPRRDGSVDPAILVAASLVGLDRIFKLGGAQAIAAMAFGTETVPKVDKIFGPGNAWVTMAKLLVSETSDGAAIDMPAGPSELLVIADASADPELVAADLLSQAEHGPDSQVVLVATSPAILDAVQAALLDQLKTLPRKDIAQQSLQHSLFIQARDNLEAMEISNRYAPEHLILQVANARSLVADVTSAGSVFVGTWSPESVGDYASGTNHVLPTFGFARSQSGLSLEAFQKTITVQELSPEGLVNIANTVETLACLEGLDAHRLATKLRRDRVAGMALNLLTASVTWPVSLARPAVQNLAAYKSARSSVLSAPVLLDANENPWSPLGNHPNLNRYPAPQPPELLAKFSSLYGVDSKTIIIGRGSDDLIDWLLRCFCEAQQDSVLLCPPTYGVYTVFADLQGAQVHQVPLGPAPHFAPDPKRILSAWRPTDKLVFLCSPNNPTGQLVDPGIVREVARALGDQALLVLDEAYVEFSSKPSMTSELSDLPNLVVLRTLSKAFGLAGARCGAGIAHPDIIGLLQKVRSPYPLPTPAVRAVLETLTDEGIAQARLRIEALLAERNRMTSALQALPAVREVYPSDANFLLVRFADAAAVIEATREAGIIVRDRSQELNLEGCVRITVGSPEENDLLFASLAGLGG